MSNRKARAERRIQERRFRREVEEAVAEQQQRRKPGRKQPKSPEQELAAKIRKAFNT